MYVCMYSYMHGLCKQTWKVYVCLHVWLYVHVCDMYSDTSEKWSNMKWAQVASVHNVPMYKNQKKHL